MSGAGPSLFPGEVPSWSVLKFPPDAAPPPITNPYSGEPTLANPFQIPQDIFEKALDPKVPLTIAAVYAVTVTYLNWYNRQHGNKPWRIASHGWFKAFVIAHNIFLAVYSALTCVAMFYGLKASFPNWREPNAFVGTVDALCKIQGPRGLGDAVTYNPESNSWGSRNTNIHVGPNGLPDSTDVGRMWNEGLAFWGWWFYLSKFYEVLDTVIILVKGKRSTTLQKYHHAGAMLSMWAGMRYMSPPIWMFVQINSGIHAMMYTYYTLSALGYRVPNFVKRTLTTMQITQFLVGASFAAVHLLVSYTVPVSVAHKIAEQVASSVQPSSIASSVSSAVESVTETASAVLPTATGPALAFLWKLVYRAAGDEGLAENIPVPGSSIIPAQQSHTPTPIAAHHENLAQRILHPHHNTHTVDRVVYRTEYQHVPCIDTSGQAFAIYLNLIYLAPLTGLFMRFFVKSYFRRTNSKAKHQSKHTPISKAAGDALHGFEREIESISEEGKANGNNGSVRGRKGANGDVKNARASLSPSVQEFGNSVVRKASQRLQEISDEAPAATEKAKQVAKDVLNQASEAKDKVQQQAKETNDKIEQKAQQNADDINAEREQGENDVASTPAGTPSKKKRNRNKNKNKNKDQSQSVESLNDASDDEHPERKTEKEPEPKDINNTLDKSEGKGLF